MTDRPTSPRFSPTLQKWTIRAVSLIVVITVWQLIGQYVNSSYILPTPLEVASGLSSLVSSGLLLGNLSDTLVLFALGFSTAVVLGIIIGIAISASKVVYNALDIYINALYATPYIALVPLFMIWLGVGFNARFAVVVLSGIFAVIINTYEGVTTASQELVETGRSFGFSGPALYTKIILPRAFPYIIAGMRISIGRSLVGAVVSQLFLELVGIGYLLSFLTNELLVADVVGLAVVIGLIGLALTETLKYSERVMGRRGLAGSGG
jgi:ABC-type nitrate/sulfonate/bicarbonate transport system permease component